MPELGSQSNLSVENLDAGDLLQLGLTAEGNASSGSGEAGRFVPPTLELLADRFPELEILEPIGYGGMGCVYKARQKHLDRIVALKILPAELSQDPAFAERFAREARMLAKLSHPNIVTIHDFGQAREFSYLVMEYVDGMNLREVLRTGGLEPPQSLVVLSALAAALDYAHAEGVVHRDIKPENILFDRRGHVKLADFGLAKLAYPSAVNPTLTLTRQALGTPHYMAPEQWESPLQVDHRADIYALGVVGYEMLTGRLPVGKFDAPSTLAKLSPVVDDVIHKALHRDPAKRYQEAREIQDALAPVVSGAPQKVWSSPFGKDTEGFPLKRWEGMFREWASEYWPSRPVRSTLQWIRDEIVAAAKFAGRGLAKLPWGAIAGFFLILGMVHTDWAVGQVQYYRGPYSDTVARGFDGFQTLTSFGVIRVENYWMLVVAGGILFLSLFRPIFGARADLLAILLAGYGVLHVICYFNTRLDSVLFDPAARALEYRAAPLITGITFAVLLVSLVWSMLARVVLHFQETPQADRHFLKSFYQSLLGLPPR
jgi:tRNA A-37 threonylcarbamoyl transferase component Bud32